STGKLVSSWSPRARPAVTAPVLIIVTNVTPITRALAVAALRRGLRVEWATATRPGTLRESSVPISRITPGTISTQASKIPNNEARPPRIPTPRPRIIPDPSVPLLLESGTDGSGMILGLGVGILRSEEHTSELHS